MARPPRWMLVGLLAGLTFVVTLRIALPSILIWYVEREILRSGRYQGTIGDVDVAVWRGQYRIQDLRIQKLAGRVATPFFQAKAIDVSLEWRELFHGAVVGEVIMVRPEVTFVAGPTPSDRQSGAGVAWGDLLASLSPVRLNRMEIRRGEVHFRNDHSVPSVDLALGDLEMVVTNLSNSRDLAQKLPAGVVARATTIGGGQASLRLRLDPLAQRPTFEMSGELTGVDLVALNEFLRAYGDFDVERGTFSLFTSVASQEGEYAGNLKVLFEDLDVFSWRKERGKNVLEQFWQGVVGTLTAVFKNQPKDRLATVIPVSGTVQEGDVDVWSAALALLKNAFVRALLPRIDHEMTIQQLKAKDDGARDGNRPEAQSPRAASQAKQPLD